MSHCACSLAEELAIVNKQYDYLKQSSEVQRSTALRGLLTSLKNYTDYELNDIIDALPDEESDLNTLIRTRIRNVLRRLDTELAKHPVGGST